MTLAELKQVADALPAGFPFTDGRTFDLFDVGKHADLVLAELHAGGCPGGPGTPEAEADAREPLRAQDKKAA